MNQSNEWKHPGSPLPKKVHPMQCIVRVMIIVVYDIDVVILHHAVTPKTDGKCCLMLHVPAAAPPLSGTLKKTMILGVTEPHHSS